MKVLWLAHAIPYPPKAGFLLRSYHLLRELARHNRVDLIAFVQEPWVRTVFPSLKVGLDESHSALSEFCHNVTFLPIESMSKRWGKQMTACRSLLSGSSYTASWLVSSPARSSIMQQLDADQYDLVHFDTVGLAAYRPLAPDVPATLNHHNVESHMMLRRAANTRNPVARSYFRLEGSRLRAFEQRVAEQFALHITCSELDSERLKAVVPGAKTVVVPNGVDCEYFTSRNPEPENTSLVFVGTMNWYPNADAMMFFLREIWPGIKQRIPTATMDIAGSNPPAAILDLSQKLLGVTVHGYVPDVRPLIESAAIVVCPIRDGGGTKLKLLDAFAMRKCVVATPIACEGIDVTPDENVVLAATPTEFIDRIATLFGDPSKRCAVGRAARALVEDRYSARMVGARFATTLESVARSRVHAG
jgi:sugar transferase (PEP-CTERM/EpsH1 system associated)